MKDATENNIIVYLVWTSDQVILLIKLSPVQNITNVMTYENLTRSSFQNKYFHFGKGGALKVINFNISKLKI